MSKFWKKMQLIRKRELDHELGVRSEEYAREHDLDEISAPSVDELESVVKNEDSLDHVLFDVANQCDTVMSKIRTTDDLNIEDIGRHLRILKAACRVAIAKIETGW